MTVILDVSGVMHLLLNKNKAEIFDEIIQEADLVLAPNIYISELTNALWKHHTIEGYSINDCINYIDEGLNYINRYVDNYLFWQEAFLEGANNKHSVYDMFYMVVARKYDAVLLTDDSDLARICKENGVDVVY